MEQIERAEQLGKVESLQKIRNFFAGRDGMPSDDTIRQIAGIYGLAVIVVYAIAQEAIRTGGMT